MTLHPCLYVCNNPASLSISMQWPTPCLSIHKNPTELLGCCDFSIWYPGSAALVFLSLHTRVCLVSLPHHPLLGFQDPSPSRKPHEVKRWKEQVNGYTRLHSLETYWVSWGYSARQSTTCIDRMSKINLTSGWHCHCLVTPGRTPTRTEAL